MSGGGETGGTVVGGPSPLGAALASQTIGTAAQAASDEATQATNNAINSLNQAYMGTVSAVQPYAETGVQALDQLNQYLGLSPYNPGPAPVAPTFQTQQSEMGNVTSSEVQQYISQNISPIVDAVGSVRSAYTGAGATNSIPASGSGSTFIPGADYGPDALPWGGAPGHGMDPAVGEAAENQSIEGEAAIQGLAQNYLANQMANQANQTYQSQEEIYQQQLAAYNQNQAWAQQYNAEGPLTSQQITNKISNQPGFQAQLQEGENAINNNAGAKGLVGSGAVLQQLMQFGQQQLSSYYNTTLGQLSTEANSGQQASNTLASASSNLGNSTAGLQSELGNTQANSSLASGNAMAQAILSANQQYQVLGQSSTGSNLSGIGSALGGLVSLASQCSREYKIHIKTMTPLSTKEILEKIQNLDLQKWMYRGIDTIHLGPYAEDFKKSFGVGDGKTINMVDAIGVLLASVKELTSQVNTLKSQLRVN